MDTNEKKVIENTIERLEIGFNEVYLTNVLTDKGAIHLGKISLLVIKALFPTPHYSLSSISTSHLFPLIFKEDISRRIMI